MMELMIDLETLSTHKDARIMTIAAVRFDINTGDIDESMHIGLYKFGYDYLNSHTSQDTVYFWVDDAQKIAFKRIEKLINSNPYTTDRGLEKLAKFITKKPFNGIWSNGASFDLAILHSAYTAFDIPIPWLYWQERDTRTIVDVARQITGIDPKKQVIFEGQPHDALCDATYQAKYSAQAFAQLKKLGYAPKNHLGFKPCPI